MNKFLDLETGLPRLWQQVLARLETHNTSTITHQDIRDTISSLTTTVNNKVSKETGKGLSTNDYTTVEKTKLSGIADGANKTVVDSSLSTTSTNPVQNKVINAALNNKAATSTTDSLQSSINTLNTKVATAATQSAMGMMSATDKTKLDGIATGANKITVDSVLSSSSTNPVQNKAINAALAAKATTDSVKTVSDALSAFKNTKGAASGLAPLNASSKIDSTYLPSYVDDVLEYAGKSNFPSSGETGKIYVDTATNLTYRWSGSAYVEISPSIALGTTSSTAFRGDYGNAAYTHAVTNKGKAFSSGLYKITTNDEGHVTAVSAVAKSDLTNLGVMDASSIVSISKGGTGSTTASEALTNLGAVSKSGDTMTGHLTVGTSSTTSEMNITARAASGAIYFYASGLSGGNRGIYTYNADGANTSVITINSSNGITFYGNATSASSVAWTNISGRPSTLANPNTLTISLNGTSQGAYDGSVAKSINITASAIGAATSSHTHSYLPLSGGTIDGKLQIGNSSASTTTVDDAGIAIRDLRECTITPSTFNSVMTPYFHRELNTSDWKSVLHMKGWTGAQYAAWELAGNANISTEDNLYFRSGIGASWDAWRTLLHSNNYTNYTVSKTGSGASGTWGINISGNAATATTITGTLPIANGGTGATSASGARTNLGISHTTTSDSGILQQVSKFGDFQIITGLVTGVAVSSSSYQDVVVTFANAFSQVPHVVVGLQSSSTAGQFGRVNAAFKYTGSMTQLTIRVANGDSSSRQPNLTFIAMGTF